MNPFQKRNAFFRQKLLKNAKKENIANSKDCGKDGSNRIGHPTEDEFSLKGPMRPSPPVRQGEEKVAKLFHLVNAFAQGPKTIKVIWHYCMTPAILFSEKIIHNFPYNLVKMLIEQTGPY